MRQAKTVLALVAFVVGTNCGRRTEVLTQLERDVCARAGIPEALGIAMKALGSNLRALQVASADGQPVSARGVTFDVPQHASKNAVRELRTKVPPEFAVFISEQNFGIDGKPDRVSVMVALSFVEVITAVGTAGWNYDIAPEAVAKRLGEWDSRYGLVLVGAGSDWFEAEFSRPPVDMHAFAKEVYAFCPDVVDQGTETVEALADEMRRENMVYLWWD